MCQSIKKKNTMKWISCVKLLFVVTASGRLSQGAWEEAQFALKPWWVTAFEGVSSNEANPM